MRLKFRNWWEAFFEPNQIHLTVATLEIALALLAGVLAGAGLWLAKPTANVFACLGLGLSCSAILVSGIALLKPSHC